MGLAYLSGLGRADGGRSVRELMNVAFLGILV